MDSVENTSVDLADFVDVEVESVDVVGNETTSSEPLVASQQSLEDYLASLSEEELVAWQQDVLQMTNTYIKADNIVGNKRRCKANKLNKRRNKNAMAKKARKRNRKK